MQLDSKFLGLILSVCCFNNSLDASFNNFGQIGYIITPSAVTLDEASFSYQLSRGDPLTTLNITASPYKWLDANIFYLDISNKTYPGSLGSQSYKDKGFNSKISLYSNQNIDIAFGLNDFGGTGYNSSEYLVATKQYHDFEFTVGIGWGVFDNGIRFKNPLTNIDKRFGSRETVFNDGGGQPEFNKLFTGKNASIFGGGSFRLNNNVEILFEYDPTNTNRKIKYKESKTKVNIGVLYSKNEYSFSTSFVRGNELRFQFNYLANYKNYKTHKIKSRSSNKKGYKELQTLLENNKIGLESVRANDDKIVVNVRQNSFENQYSANSIIVDSIKQTNSTNQDIQITQSYLDMEVVSVFYNSHKLINAKEEIYSEKNYEKDLKTVYKVKYPEFVFINNYFPVLRSQVASREGFIFNALLIENSTEVIYKDNLVLLANLKYSLYDNFDDLYLPPVDTYPAQVRSDIKKYLNNFDNGIILGRLELNYFKSFYREHFLRFSAGYYEEMFGGAGFDYLYYPEGSLLSFGFESYYVRKRNYDLKFGFQEFDNVVTRGNIGLLEPQSNTHFKISYGEYLAGDVGYTIDMSKRFDNGIEFGVFFSRTNVSKQEYGEGSFDKGIKFRIPFSLFDRKNLSRYEWHPLTKDPAALLTKSVDLRNELVRYRTY